MSKNIMIYICAISKSCVCLPLNIIESKIIYKNQIEKKNLKGYPQNTDYDKIHLSNFIKDIRRDKKKTCFEVCNILLVLATWTQMN